MTQSGDSARPSVAAFVSTFVAVPILTYIVCVFAAWYFTSASSRQYERNSLLRFPRQRAHGSERGNTEGDGTAAEGNSPTNVGGSFV